MIKIRNFTLLLLAVIIINGCSRSDEAEARTIQQIQEAEGIPVMITEIVRQPFVINYSYTANLSGIKETTVTSSIADRVEAIMVNVGDYVEKDQLLITFPEDSSMGQYTQVKAVYDNTLATYERMKSLFETGGISRSALEQLETGLIVSKANYDAASKAIKVKAPFSGYVTKVFIRETESVGMGDELIAITVLDKYKAKVWAPESELKDIRVGSKAAAIITGSTLPGRVVQVAQSMDTSRQAFIVDLEFDNPSKLKISGLLATINIAAYQNDGAIVIPRQFIHSPGQADSYVYLAQGDNAVRRDVAAARNDGLRFEVIEGLSVGDRLITQGTNSVMNGSLIRVIEN